MTNGSKNTNGSTATSSSETSATPGLFTNKPPAPNSDPFGVQTSATPLSTQPTMLTSPFATTVKSSPSILFTASNVDSAKETPFKIQPVSSSGQIGSTKSMAQTTPSVFGVSSSTANDSKTLFSTTNSTPFKIQPASSTNTAMVQTCFGITKPAVTSVTPERKSDDSGKSNKKKIIYFSKLKGLNESVSDWINKHVAQTPFCILSPIFKDYEKYFKEITEEYESADKEDPGNNMDVETPDAKTGNVQNTITSSPFALNNTGSSLFTKSPSSETTKTLPPFGNSNLGASPSKNSTSNQEAKTSTPFGLNNAGASPLTSQNTKMSSPFVINNSGSSPLNSRDTKTHSPFPINNTGSPPLTSPNTKTPFGIQNTGSSLNSQNTNTSALFGVNNTGSSPLNSQNTNTSTPFAINTGTSPLSSQNTKTSTPFGVNNKDLTPFNSSPPSAIPKPSLFGAQNNLASSPENKQSSFSFNAKTSTTNSSSLSTPSPGFSFGVTPSATSATSSLFTPTNNASTNPASTAPFSFGNGKPFSFSPSTVQQTSSEPAAAENEDEGPPKVEYTPVKEENSVYEKKCKIFVKKEGNFADKGVGTLYIKKIEGNVKHQLLVRANTNLGTVLLNLVLAEAIPTQRMGKNNVMMVCIPTPDADPPPTPILIRVKTGEEADELLETLNKYKA